MNELEITHVKSARSRGRGTKRPWRPWGPDYQRRSLIFLASAVLILGAGLAARVHRPVRSIHQEQPVILARVAPRQEPWRELCTRHSPHPTLHRTHKQVPRKLVYRTLPQVGVLRLQHAVDSMVFSPDGRMLASGTGDLDDNSTPKSAHETVTLWRIGRSHWRRVSSRPGGAIVAYSPDGRILATGDISGQIELRRTSSGRLIGRLKCEYSILFLVFSPDGNTLLSGNSVPAHCGGMRPGEVILWDLKHRRPKLHFENDLICTAAFSHDDKRIAIGDRDNTISLMNYVTGRWLHHTIDCSHPEMSWEECSSGAFSPDDRTIASSCGVVQLWNSTTRKLQGTLPMSEDVTAIAFSPNGKLLAGAGDERVMIWNVRTKRLLFVLRTSRQTPTVQNSDLAPHNNVSIAFSPEGRLLAAGCEDGAIHIWRLH